jgi:hypothetical protein
MNKKTSMLAFSFISFCFLANVAVAWDGDGHKHHNKDYKDDTNVEGAGGMVEGAGGMHEGLPLILVKLTGTGAGYLRPVPGFDEEALCFDIDLLDLRTNKIIGGATDCISAPQMNVDGVEFVGTTYLYFPDGNTIATQGNVSVRSVAEENIVLRTGQKITNITGSATTGNTFIEGESTGIYKNSTGNARISGMINTENFAFNVGDEQFFDCIFEIQIDSVDSVDSAY